MHGISGVIVFFSLGNASVCLIQRVLVCEHNIFMMHSAPTADLAQRVHPNGSGRQAFTLERQIDCIY